MHQVSWKKPLALAVTLVILSSAAYWLVYKQKPAEEAKDEASKKLFSVKDTPVRSITIVSGDRKFSLSCLDAAAKLCKPGDNSKWEVTQPIKLKADDSSANTLLSALNNVNVTETIDLKDETAAKRAEMLKEYGLDPESLPKDRKIEVTTDSGKTVLYLGLPHPIGDSIFGAEEKVAGDKPAAGKIDDTKIYLVPAYFKSNLEHDLTYWRDKKLLTVASHDVESFKLADTQMNVTCERKDGEWTIHDGKDVMAGDIENIDNILSGATFISAKNFVSDDKSDAKAKAALKGTKAVVTLSLQPAKGAAKETPPPVVLTIFEKKGDKKQAAKDYATVSNLDPLFEIDGYAKDRLDKGLKDIRMTKLITSMERFSAKRLEFAGAPIGAPPILLVNKDGKWISQPDGAEAPSEKVQSVLDKISGPRIRDFVQGSAIPTGEDKGLRFTLGIDKDDSKRQIVFWKVGDKLFARDLKSKRKEAFVVDSTIASGLPWTRDFFKSAPKTSPSGAASAPKK